MADNIISSSKKEIYTKLLDIAEKYTDIKDTDYLKTGLFGYITESMASMMRDSVFHKSMMYNEHFLNKAVLPSTVYNWAKTFNVEVQKATPGYVDIELIIDLEAIVNFMPDGILRLDRENMIVAGDDYYSLEHSIIISSDSDSYTARYDMNEYTSTSFQDLNNVYILPCVINKNNLVVRARAYQYRQVKYKRQITQNTFMNKVQRYEFEGQFCGASLFYTDNQADNFTQINLSYSDINITKDKLSAFYNLTDENVLEIVFKNGDNYFMPASNSQLTLMLYSTNGTSANKNFTGDAVMLFTESDLKALPLVIHFKSSLMGAKNQPTIYDIKKKIINELSTRNTVTTATDLNNYFDILTSLVSDVNDGKVKFIKKRDDILKRTYNAYLLLRDNSVDDESANENTFISPCVPTNTLSVATLDKSKAAVSEEDSTTTVSENEVTSSHIYRFPYPTFNSIGEFDPNGSGEFICPFDIFVKTTNPKFVKFIYELTDDSAVLEYDTTAGGEEFLQSGLYIIPKIVSVYRDFATDTIGYHVSDNYTFYFSFTTNFDIALLDTDNSTITIKNSEGGSFGVKVVECYSEKNDDESYSTTIICDAKASVLNINGINTFADSVVLSCGDNDDNRMSVSPSEKLKFSFENMHIKLDDSSTLDIGATFKASKKLQFFNHMDTIMQSSLMIDDEEEENDSEESGTTDNKGLMAITEVPVVHKSFFENATDSDAKRKGFISQLFTYINLLKENLDKLETSTSFNLKFYNTYGRSYLYDTLKTNLLLELEITLVDEYKDGENSEDLKKEIKSYIRRIVDKSNDTEGLAISTITALLTNQNTYGKYIDHITFIGLNDMFIQHIDKLDNVDPIEYPPEWFNLETTDYINFN